MQRRTRLGTAGMLAALCLIAALGEFRPAASAAVQQPSRSAEPAGFREAAVSGSAMPDVGADADGASGHTDEPEDAARLAPALFAPNPDVHFVFSRRISKWM